MADLNRALQINPGNIFASYDRARARDAAGDHGGALSDYSDVIAGDARFAPAYLGRGLDRHAQNDISGAVADYEEYLASYPDAEQPQLYREILRRWTGAPPRDLTADTVKWKDDWARGLGKYISGSLSEADLRALAATGPEAAARVCVAEYFTGLMHFLNHDLAGARTRWEKCVSLNATVPEVRFAQSALSFLNSVPAP